MKKYKVGYTQGVYDMFHVGHLNLINHAKEQCDFLVVGVNSDDLVRDYKSKETVIKEADRLYIIENIKAVDKAVIVDTLDKIKIWENFHFDAIFIGDDWKGNPRWEQTAEQLKPLGADVVFLPYTQNVSSTILKPEKGRAVSEN